MMHRQETVECLKKFNARRKLKVSDHRNRDSRYSEVKSILVLKTLAHVAFKLKRNV